MCLACRNSKLLYAPTGRCIDPKECPLDLAVYSPNRYRGGCEAPFTCTYQADGSGMPSQDKKKSTTGKNCRCRESTCASCDYDLVGRDGHGVCTRCETGRYLFTTDGATECIRPKKCANRGGVAVDAEVNFDNDFPVVVPARCKL